MEGRTFFQKNYHFHLFFNGEDSFLTEGLNDVHYNSHTPNQCNTPSLTEGQSDFHYNFDINSMYNIITIPDGGGKN